MNETLAIDDLLFALRYSARRKTVGIMVGGDGSLEVCAPAGCARGEIEACVRRRLAWVYARLGERRGGGRVEKEYVSGEGFAYLGRSYRLLLVDGEGPALRLAGGRFLLRKGEAVRGAEHFARWYSEHAGPWLARQVGRFAGRMGVSEPAVEVADLGGRWSAVEEGRVRFHWRVICLPPSIIEYVVADALARRAGDAALVGRVLPDGEERRRWLAENGGRY
jgi:predicted metal-dependent hydrolase